MGAALFLLTFSVSGHAREESASSVAAATEPCDLVHLDAKRTSYATFMSKYRLQRPVLFTNVGKDWPARTAWTASKLRRRFGDRRVLSTHMHGGAAVGGPWFGNETVQFIIDRKASKQVYAFLGFHSMVKDLAAEWETPNVLKGIVRDGPILSLGNKHSVVFFHFHLEGWLAQVSGRKLWIVAPGNDRSGINADRPVCNMSKTEFDVPLSKRKIQWCVVKPQQAIYVPQGWWHGTCNLDNQNYGIGYIGGWSGQLHQYCATGDLPAVQRALQKVSRSVASAQVIENDETAGLSPIAAASMRGHVDVLKALATYYTPEASYETLNVALIGGSMSGHGPIAKILLSLRADLYTVNSQITPLTEAAKRGHVELLTALIEVRGDVNAAVAKNLPPLPGSPLVTKAANSGHRELVAFLLDSVPGIASLDQSAARTLLHTSLEWPHVAEYLVQRGENLNSRDGQGRSAAHIVANGFIKPQESRRFTCNEDLLSLLLREGAVVDAKDDSLEQPLHVTALKGHVSCTEVLLQHGAEVNAITSKGGSAVTIAAEAGHWNVVQALVRSGGNVNKAVRRLAKKSGAQAWLKEHERTEQGECDIMYGTCDL